MTVNNNQSKRLQVVGISGSLRRDSYNRKVLQIAKQIAVKLGTEVEEVDLKQLELPVYDGDIESQGFPAAVVQMRDFVEHADVLLIASPEYNHSISGALKNAIDWLSVKKNIISGKTAAIFGASTGLYGAIRAQIHLRQILTALNISMLPQPQVFIRSANEAFNENGSLKDISLYNQLKELVEKTISLAKDNIRDK